MGDGDPRVAVVMITHNRRIEVLCTLERLNRLPERPQVVVVDNASTDGTATAVAERHPAVEVLTPGRNLGASGRTLGVRHVETPYVAFCDDDTWWEPGALRRAADLFDANPRLALVNGRVLVEPEGAEDPTCSMMANSPLPPEPGLPGRPILGFLAGASVVRRSAFLEAGGFEPRLFLGGEEELLATDLVARGWRLCYVPEILSRHHPSHRRDVPARRGHMLRNALWFAWLRRPLPSALRRTLATAFSTPWDRVTLRGFAAAFAGLPWVLRERRVVPPNVEEWLRLLEAIPNTEPGPA
jgi:GT2 family glycosyltransferase